MLGMTHEHQISPDAKKRQDDARLTDGKFGEQAHTPPQGGTLAVPTPPEETTYGVYADGTLISMGERGAGMSDALNRARVYLNGYKRASADEPFPTVTIRSEGSTAEVRVPLGGEGRLVAWHGFNGALTAEDMDEKCVSLTQLDSELKLEPFLELPYDEGNLNGVEEILRQGDFDFSEVYAKRDEETGGRHVDVSVYENFLWNAEGQCPDDEYDDDSDLDPNDDREPAVQRYTKWLDDNEQVVKEVFEDVFNAEIDVYDTWDNARVTIRKTFPYERFTESLVVDEMGDALLLYRDRVDPGTFGAPYVMDEVRRRVEEYEAEMEREKAQQ